MEEANGSGGEGDIGGLGESEDRRHFLIRVKKISPSSIAAL